VYQKTVSAVTPPVREMAALAPIVKAPLIWKTKTDPGGPLMVKVLDAGIYYPPQLDQYRFGRAANGAQ
jgi:hypothetical protein